MGRDEGKKGREQTGREGRSVGRNGEGVTTLPLPPRAALSSPETNPLR